MIPFILKSSSISLFPADAAPIVIDNDHPNFSAVASAIKAGDFEEALSLASVSSYFNKISAGNVAVSEDGVTYKGAPLTGYLADKLVLFYNEGLPMDHYVKFLDNLMDNPSMTSRNELFLFLEAADLPITEDGCFLAYKAVDGNLRDKHTGKFDNSPGQTLTMDRRNVDDNRNQTCSYGFHAAAYNYAKGFLSGPCDRMVAVKINPADVVSVPSDYDNQKLRTCRYEVMFEIPSKADVFKGKSHITVSTYDDGEDDLPF